MFQNLDMKNVETNERSIENNYNKDRIEAITSIIGQAFKKNNIIIYILTLMLSMVSFGDGIQPFSIAIFGAACANSIPLAIIYIVTIIGNLIKFGGTGVLNFLLISLLFIALVLIFKPWYEEEYKNERRKLGKYVFLSSFIIQIVELLFNEFLIYNFLIIIVSSLSSYIFYKIFAESLPVIYEWKEKTAFSIEEIIGAILMISIALLTINNFQLFGLNVGQVLMIVMILILGWKNGIMVGATAGITVGAVIGVIGNENPIIIATFALSGMIAGILNRFGKIGVVIGFMIGNAILTYVYNGNTVAIVYFKEILVASLMLILVPKNIEINIEDLFDKRKALPDGTIYRLEANKGAAKKLSEVSNLIHEMSDKYIEKESEIDQRKEIFLDELEKKLEEKGNNVLFEDIYDFENGIANEAYEVLKNKNIITNNDLEDIFKRHNTYIVTLNNESNIENFEVQQSEITHIINDAFRISNVNYFWGKKITDNKRVISNQLENVSQAISKIAEDMNTDNIEKYKKEISQIKILANKKNIKILNIKIEKKEEKFIVDITSEVCTKNCYTENIAKILSDILKSEMVLQNKKCAIDKNLNICKQIYTTKNNYLLTAGISKRTKDKSVVTGDSYIKTKLDDGKVLIALSDGMGSGNNAKKASNVAIEMLERLLKSGFEKETSLKLINNTMCLNSKDDMYATLDIAVIDLFNGRIEMIKNGSCPTYIKTKNNIELIKSFSLPAGILDNIELITYEKIIGDGDIIVMCTDGIIDSDTEHEDKENWIKELLSEIKTEDVTRIAEIILQEAVDKSIGRPKDDMTVIAFKILKR